MPKGSVHPTAIIEDGARVGSDVRVGPYCVVGGEVVLGDGVELVSHVAVAGRTTIGAKTRIFPFASIGHQPQDLKYKGEPSTLTVGSECLIREGVTMNPGTEGGGMQTVIGDRCAFLAEAPPSSSSRGSARTPSSAACRGWRTI
jgi:UDP-N-acetylglucosamine acyltransferase